jgi:uncharacterized protein YqjF (DUF2071 family)
VLHRAVTTAADFCEIALAPLAAVWPAVAQGRVVREQGHRPWPMPAGPWLMAQTWEDLLFAHWPVPTHLLRPLVPEPLSVDTFDGDAWVGITPFEVTGLRLRGTVPAPRVSRFPELNVRTYATFAGKPGIWFFSLDAGSALAVAAARRSYRLPYFRADMSIARSADGISYRAVRTSPDARRAELEARYTATGEPRTPLAGSLEHWLTERYCLYALDERRRLLRADIHHPPWRLQATAASFRVNTMAPESIELPAAPSLLHFARRQDVVIWPPRAVAPHDVDRG